MWVWWWLLFLFVFLLLPTGYGWGYRRWGPPYPSWYRRRRSAGDVPIGARDATANGWGWVADLLWILFAIWLAWLLVVWIF